MATATAAMKLAAFQKKIIPPVKNGGGSVMVPGPGLFAETQIFEKINKLNK